MRTLPQRPRGLGRLASAASLAATALIGCNAVFGLDPSTLAADASDERGDEMPSLVDGSDGSPRSNDGSLNSSGSSGGVDGSSSGSGSGSSGGRDGATIDMADGSVGKINCPTACAAGLVCERYEGPVCLPPDWPEWPMPNWRPDVMTGAPNEETYTDNGDGTVTDDVTGLMWQQTAPTASYTQPGGITYCSMLSLAGHHDWRLPSEPELGTLVDYARSSPSIDLRYFPDGTSLAVWSSTLSTGKAGWAWGITFITGVAGENITPNPNSVRCVR